MDQWKWRAGSGALEDWLAGIFDRFALSPRGFTVERGGEKTYHFDGPPNTWGSSTQEVGRTHPRTVAALVSDLADDDVREVGLVIRSTYGWSLSAVPQDRSKTDWIHVDIPGARSSHWPLPATLRDSRDLRRLLVALARTLGAAPPDDDPGSPSTRYPRPVEVEGTVSSDTYSLRVTGWGPQTLSLRGETSRLVDGLARPFAQETMRLPLDSPDSLTALYEILMADLGRRSAGPPVPGDTRLPPDARLTVTRTPGAEPSLEVTAENLLIEADHPGHSLRERVTLLLCPQLYTPCAPADLPAWLRSLEKGVFGRSGIWTVRGREWRPPRHRGAAMVARALLEQGLTGRGSVTLACAEFLTVQGLLLGGEPVELTGRSKVKSR